MSTEYPELGDTLNYGILPQDLASVEMQFGFSLPQVIRESYLMVDGQEPESSAGCSEGLFFGLHLLPLEEVLEEWRFWREVDDDPNTGAHPQLREYMQSVPPGWIRKEYSQRGWIPLMSDKTGNYVGIDINPGEGGSVGQVIVFGRDFDTKVVLWKGDGPAGWATWLASFAEVLESGEGFELGASTESEGSEDDVGYEGYFFDGTGRGAGEGTGGMSSGGIRLTGEYRGWTTLEAWADRSVRKWQQVGLVPDPPVGQKGKVCVGFILVCASNPYSYSQEPEKVGLGVMDITNAATGSGAEIPIPVLMDVSNTASSQRYGQGAVGSLEISQKSAVPVISITKPPAPLPVDLPTHDEIVPTSLDFDSHPDDIESGGSLMREIGHHTRTTGSSSPRSSLSDPHSPQTTPPPLPSAPTTSLPRVADLLGDPTPSLVVSPAMEPSSSARPSPRTTSPPLLLPIESTPIEADGPDPEGEELGATIRLVGNTSEVGLAPDSVQSDETDDTSSQAYDTASSLNGSSLPPSRASHSAQDLREGQPGF